MTFASRLLPRLARGLASPTTSGFGPDSIEVQARALRVGEGWCRSFAVVGYPRQVGRGWLEPLSSHPGRIDISLHIEPVPTELAAARLRRQLARLEASRRADAAKGRLADPEVEVAAGDARSLADGLARGEQKLFRVGLYLTVHALTVEQLDADCARARALCASMLLDARPATWRQLQGWATSLPICMDAIASTRSFDTAALAASYPFASAVFDHPDGVLYGTTLDSKGTVFWDRYRADNHNSVILARSGAGKSYLAKLETLRSLYRGVQVFVVDPEDEYRRLADAIGGAYLHLGGQSVRLNPLDLAPGPDPLVQRALFAHTLVAVMLGARPDPEAAAVLDRAVLAAYEKVGITADVRSHARPAPVLADVTAALEADGDPAGPRLAARLAPFVTGSFRGLFDGPTTTQPHSHLVVFSLRDVPAELKPAATVIVLDAIWRQVSDPDRRRRRLVTVDEAWLLMADPAGAEFLFRMAKSARKHHAGLAVVTQDPADLLAGPLGQAVVANAATQILLRQAPQSIDTIADAFGLSHGERAFLLAAQRGEGLLAAGTDRVAFKTVASPDEHRLCVTGLEDALADLPDL